MGCRGFCAFVQKPFYLNIEMMYFYDEMPWKIKNMFIL